MGCALACHTSGGSGEPQSRPETAEPKATRPALGRLPASEANGEAATVTYILRFPAPQTHYLSVEARFAFGGKAQIELMMPVWTPGSYKIRDYSRHVESVRAFGPDDGPLPAEKTAKNRWQVQTRGNDLVIVRYDIYCRVVSAQSNWVEPDFAVLNGAAMFMTRPMAMSHPHDLQVELPDTWLQVATSLPPHPSGREHAFRAPNFDTLIDSPLLLGQQRDERIDVGGKEHHLVTLNADKFWDNEAAAYDVSKIVVAHQRFWGSVPYDRYLFLNVLAEARGGLEHDASTLLISSRWKYRVRDGYLNWLSLVSHEFFHTWNVKRLRPKGLGPFDYEKETYTPSLWIAEGFTAYYDDLLVHRAGLSSEKEYLEALSENLRKLQTTPGRTIQPLAEASFDTWIKYHTRAENKRNSSISYYCKGAIVAFLLDAEIRRSTAGRKSLDHAMRLAYDRHAEGPGYTPEEFLAGASEVAGRSLEPWFAHALQTTDELDYEPALKWYGLRFKLRPDKAEGDEKKHRPEPWLGVELEVEDGLWTVSRVRRDGPAFVAGLTPKDELVAIDGYRLGPGGLAERLLQYAPGDEVELLLARQQRLQNLAIKVAETPSNTWQLEAGPKATAAQKARRRSWLHGRP